MIVFNTLTILLKGIHITVELTKLSCRLAGAGQTRKERRVPVQPDEISLIIQAQKLNQL
jgi:hypothetical protein